MAGCHSVLADLLDEKPLATFHAVKLVKEVLMLDVQHVSAPLESESASEHFHVARDGYDPLLWLEDTEAYLELVRLNNFNVFDFRARCSKPVIDVVKLESKIWWYRLWHERLAGSGAIRRWRDWCDDNGVTRFVLLLRWPALVLCIACLLRLQILEQLLRAPSD